MKKQCGFNLFEKFLREKEVTQQSFTLEEISYATRYRLSTVTSYISKKLIGYLVYREESGLYISSGITRLSSTDFLNHMGQKSIPIQKNQSEVFIEKLRERSVDALILAIENYNRLSIRNRVEAFAIWMINAWELLLKSIAAEELGYKSLFYQDSEHSLCINKVVQKLSVEKKLFADNNPVKKNIELLIDLRDKSIHLLIPELQPQLGRLFQSSVFNYIELYKNKIGKSPIVEQGFGLLSLVIDSESIQYPVINSNYGQETATEVKSFLEKFKQTETDLNSSHFAIPVEYKLALIKKESDSDIIITTGKEGDKAVIIDKPCSPDKTHPFRTKDAIKLINQKIHSNKLLNNYSFRALVFKHKIRGDNRYHYHINLSKTTSYNQALIDKFVNLINSNPQLIEQAIQFYQQNNSKIKQNQDKIFLRVK